MRLDKRQALALWHGTLKQGTRRRGPDLSSRQMAILLSVYLDPPPHTVRGLSAGLGVSKPAVTRALDALEKLQFLRRKPDERDRRSILVQRTVKGSVFLNDTAEQIVRAARELGVQ